MDKVHDARDGKAVDIMKGDYVVTTKGVFAYDIVHDSGELQPRDVLDFTDPVDVLHFAAHIDPGVTVVSKDEQPRVTPKQRACFEMLQASKKLVARGDESGITEHDSDYFTKPSPELKSAVVRFMANGSLEKVTMSNDEYEERRRVHEDESAWAYEQMTDERDGYY